MLLALLEVVLFAVNYIPGTYLMGWDNVMPEFNFWQALKTNIFGVWQEHRGLGLYDGMSHIANLPHTLFLWMLSYLLPQNILRYAFTFLMHFLGGLGAYLLLRHLLHDNSLIDQKNVTRLSSHPTHPLKARLLKGNHLAILVALFYQYNPAAIQMFYAPLEAFSVHFAAIPWLALTLTHYLTFSKRKDLLAFFLVVLLTTPQFFIPTLILPVGILLASISLSSFTRKESRPTFQVIKRTAIAGAGFLIINAFWLIPYLAGLPRNAPVIRKAKINQMSSEEAFLMNRARGSLADVLLLRGFMLDFTDIDPEAGFAPLMDTWRTHLASPIAITAGLALTAVSLIGVFAAIAKVASVRHAREYVVNKNAVVKILTTIFHDFSQNYFLSPFLLTFFLSFLILGNDILPIRQISDALRLKFPVLGEALRFPFTKFSLLFALSYSVFVSIGLVFLARKLHGFARRLEYAPLVIALTALIIVAFPAWQGNFLYRNLRLAIPGEYHELQQFMAGKNGSGRIAYLPQPSFWSWKYYRWGYHGSGFLWYGLQQPLMDRAFDPWSSQNENYYWELSLAIYRKDAILLEQVMDKYDLRYILLDENVVTASHNRALYTDEIKDLLAETPTIKEIAAFPSCPDPLKVEPYKGKVQPCRRSLTLHERIDENVESFVRLAADLPAVVPAYRWTDNDVAFAEVGDYITEPSAVSRQLSDKSIETTNKPSMNDELSTINFFYPFRSLFTKRAVDEREFTIEETEDTVTLSSLSSTGIATNAAIVKAEALVYDSSETNALSPSLVTPCGIDRGGTWSAEKTGDGALRFTSNKQRSCLSFGLGQLPHREGYLVKVELRHLSGRPLLFSLINQTAKHVEIETYLPAISHQSPDVRQWNTNYFILPPLAPDGLGYSVYIANDSIGKPTIKNAPDDKFIRSVYFVVSEKDITINEIRRIRVYRFPYEELVNFRLKNKESGYRAQGTGENQFNNLTIRQFNTNFSVEHPNPAYYKVIMSYSLSPEPSTLPPVPSYVILSQSYHPGWKAYEITSCQSSAVSCQIKNKLQAALPFLFGKEIKEPFGKTQGKHVLVNNWANGWVIDKSQITNPNGQCRKSQNNTILSSVDHCDLELVIFFLPQLLEFLGFALLPLPFLLLLRRR